jgi:pyruvate formate lyase activating enzyme
MISLDDLLVEIEKDRLFFDESQGGVTFSGGEPLSQSAFLSRALTLCRDRRIHSAVDTCGVGGLDALDTLALADLILFDIKGLGAESLLRETGARLSVVMETLEGLVARGRRIWLRLPFVPGYGLMKEGEDSLGKWLEPRKDWFERVCLLPFHHTAQRKYEKMGRLDGMQGIDSPSDAMIAPFLERLKESHPDVRIGG